MKTLKTTARVIDVLGGNHDVAGLLGTTHQAVSNWRRSKLPANTYVVLQIALLSKNFYAPARLWAMKLGKRKRRGKGHAKERVDYTDYDTLRAAIQKS